jgi:RimJ/RimL family protein N-acetyltransferase
MGSWARRNGLLVDNVVLEWRQEGAALTMPDDQTIILETQRLRFRRLVLDDLDALFALYRDKETRQYFPDGADGTLTYEETKKEIAWFLNGHPEHPDMGLWAIIHKETNHFVGRCGLLLWTIDGRPEVEVAYLLDKRYWRQGLGTEAAKALMRYGFEQLRLSRLVCMIDPANQASAKVARNMGMTLEREMVDEKGPFLLFSISK